MHIIPNPVVYYKSALFFYFHDGIDFISAIILSQPYLVHLFKISIFTSPTSIYFNELYIVDVYLLSPIPQPQTSLSIFSSWDQSFFYHFKLFEAKHSYTGNSNYRYLLVYLRPKLHIFRPLLQHCLNAGKSLFDIRILPCKNSSN